MAAIERKILLNPGPATTTDAVKQAQVVSDICPREHDFGQVMRSISSDLIRIVNGNDRDHACILIGGSGTAGVDSTINSVVPHGKKILIINNGAYGERMVKIAQAYSIEYVELSFEWEKLPEINVIEQAIKNDPKIACVSMIHHETTTGLLNPIKKIGALVHKYNRIFIVDTISSFAGMHLDIETFNLDFLISTSNKCIQGMPGICFVICKKDYLNEIKDYPRRSFYLNLYDQYAYFKDHGQMRFTPPVQTLYALRKAIDEFFEEGANARYARYTKNWEVLRNGVTDLGFKILTKPEEESHILITLLNPKDPNFDFDQLHDKLYAKGITIYPGKVGKIASFRLANMGAINHEDIELFLAIFKSTLKEMNVKL